MWNPSDDPLQVKVVTHSQTGALKGAQLYISSFSTIFLHQLCQRAMCESDKHDCILLASPEFACPPGYKYWQRCTNTTVRPVLSCALRCLPNQMCMSPLTCSTHAIVYLYAVSESMQLNR